MSSENNIYYFHIYQDIKETAKSFKTTESKIVLTTWGIIMNHTITELFVVLSRYVKKKDIYKKPIRIRCF